MLFIVEGVNYIMLYLFLLFSLFATTPPDIHDVSLVAEEHDSLGTESGAAFNISQYEATDFQIVPPDEYVLVL